MGKWVKVHCSCENRTPNPSGDSLFGRPHRKKRRLTNREKQEVDEWERTTRGVYECGHRNGVLLEFCPGDIIQLGNLIGSILEETTVNFEVFTRVGDWECYEDELLLISPDEAHVWLAEIEELQRSFRGLGQLQPERVESVVEQFYRQELASRIDLERRLDRIGEQQPMAPVVGLKRNVQQSTWPDTASTLERIEAALTNSAKLCNTSIESGNPIRLLW